MRNRVLLPYLVEKTVVSTKSTVLDAWCGENLTRRATQIFCTHMHCFYTMAMNRIIAVLPQSVDKSQASFPQRSTMTPAKHVPVTPQVFHIFAADTPVTCTSHPRVHPIGPQCHFRHTSQPPASSRQLSTRHPRNTCRFMALCAGTFPCASLVVFHLSTANNSMHVPKSLAIWLPSLARDHIPAVPHVRPRPE